MSATDFLLNNFCCIVFPHINGQVSTHVGGKLQLLIININTDPFMPEDYAGFVTEITVFDMQIRMTYTTALHFQKCLTMFQVTQSLLHDVHRVVFIHNSSFHFPFLIVVAEPQSYNAIYLAANENETL
ncbi:hypothetical protein SRABI106_02749 [Rahnella aquatilis]|nr:hypothetical protein SRABI106_02749 [Rahnella aquatilis]